MGAGTLTNELDERLEIARQVVREVRAAGARTGNICLRHYCLTLVQLSAFLFADLQVLKDRLQNYGCIDVACGLFDVTGLVATFSRRPNIQDIQTVEARKALIRDGHACVVTKAALPYAYHIWPSTMNDTPNHISSSKEFIEASFRLVEPKLANELHSRLYPYLNADRAVRAGSSDKAWNMISLSPKLCRYYRKAIFGFKWVERADRTLAPSQLAGDREHAYFQIELRVFPAPLAETLENILGPWETNTRFVDLDCPETVQAIRDYVERSSPGPIITLKARREDIEKTEVLIRTQWVLIQMAAFSGLAELDDGVVGSSPPVACPLPSEPPVCHEEEEEEDYDDEDDDGEDDGEDDYEGEDDGEDDYEGEDNHEGESEEETEYESEYETDSEEETSVYIAL